MAPDDPMASGQADARARKFAATVQTLKGLEKPIEILLIKANAIILHDDIDQGHAPQAWDHTLF